MTRAITVRLDEADHAALEKQAEQLRIRPGTLARILVHSGLTTDAAVVGNENARAALDRLAGRSQKRASADAVGLVAEARVALDPTVSVVVDASVLVAVVVADERQDAARVHLEGWLEAGEGLHAPAVLPYEVANVLARLVFDGALPVSEVDDIWADLAALGLVLHAFDLTKDGHDVAAITARLRRRHATDSTYVALARRLGTVVWTLDGALARNAVDLGLPVRLVA